MKFQVTVSEEDYIRYNQAFIQLTKPGRRAILLNRLLMPVFGILVVLIFAMARADTETILIEACCFVIFSIIWFFVAPWMLLKNVRSNVKKLKKMGKLPYMESAEVTLDENGFTSENKEAKVSSALTKDMHSYEVVDYIYVFYGAQAAVILPLRDLGTEADAVREYLKGCTTYEVKQVRVVK